MYTCVCIRVNLYVSERVSWCLLGLRTAIWASPQAGDFLRLHLQDLADIYVLVAGPPCLPWARAGGEQEGVTLAPRASGRSLTSSWTGNLERSAMLPALERRRHRRSPVLEGRRHHCRPGTSKRSRRLHHWRWHQSLIQEDDARLWNPIERAFTQHVLLMRNFVRPARCQPLVLLAPLLEKVFKLRFTAYAWF